MLFIIHKDILVGMLYTRSGQREETREPPNILTNMEEAKYMYKKKVMLLYNTYSYKKIFL